MEREAAVKSRARKKNEEKLNEQIGSTRLFQAQPHTLILLKQFKLP